MESPDFPDDFLAMGERPGPLNYIYLRCHRLHNLSSDFPIFYRLYWKHFGPKIHRFWHGEANRHFPCDQSGAVVCLCASAQHHGASCFQTHLTKINPKAAEQSTYILITCVALILICGFWQPLVVPVWDLRNTFTGRGLTALFWAGWVVVLASTFMIDHLDLFGLKQIYVNIKCAKKVNRASSK